MFKSLGSLFVWFSLINSWAIPPSKLVFQEGSDLVVRLSGDFENCTKYYLDGYLGNPNLTEHYILKDIAKQRLPFEYNSSGEYAVDCEMRPDCQAKFTLKVVSPRELQLRVQHLHSNIGRSYPLIGRLNLYCRNGQIIRPISIELREQYYANGTITVLPPRDAMMNFDKRFLLGNVGGKNLSRIEDWRDDIQLPNIPCSVPLTFHQSYSIWFYHVDDDFAQATSYDPIQYLDIKHNARVKISFFYGYSRISDKNYRVCLVVKNFAGEPGLIKNSVVYKEFLPVHYITDGWKKYERIVQLDKEAAYFDMRFSTYESAVFGEAFLDGLKIELMGATKDP